MAVLRASDATSDDKFALLKLGQFAKPKTSETWLGHVNSCGYSARIIREIYQVLTYSVDFKAPRELWNLLSETVLSKCNFKWIKGHVNIWNDHKAQK